MHVTGWGSQESEIQTQQVDTPGPVATHFFLPRRLPAAGDAAAIWHPGASKERQRLDPATRRKLVCSALPVSEKPVSSQPVLLGDSITRSQSNP